VPPEVVINPGREDEQHRLKSAGITLRRGDVVRGSTGGGGGYGDLARRARAAIEEDIANGDLSTRAARELYGYEGGME
jgi:N-methylhydantoinase B